MTKTKHNNLNISSSAPFTKKDYVRRKLNAFIEEVQELKRKYHAHILENNVMQMKAKGDFCEGYFRGGKQSKVAIPQMWIKPNNHFEHNISLVTQLNYERIPLLNKLTLHWTGLTSSTLYFDMDFLSHITKTIINCSMILERDNVDLHLVAKAEVRCSAP